MGGTVSRAASRAPAAAAQAAKGRSASPAQAQVQKSLEGLPETSAVRRDAVVSEQFEQWRAAHEQHLDGIPLEEQNAKDGNLAQLMQQTMQQPSGRIEYREHLLSMPEGEIADRFEAKACPAHTLSDPDGLTSPFAATRVAARIGTRTLLRFDA